jgi:DNA-binding XRE family transcriptional regulator
VNSQPEHERTAPPGRSFTQPDLSEAMVETAVEALAEFGGLTLDRDGAADLLPRWCWYPNLPPRETAVILARFPPERETFGAALGRLRTGRGLTQRKLGRLAHVHFTLLSKIENGHHTPTPTLARTLDTLLGARGRLVAAAQVDHARRAGGAR